MYILGISAYYHDSAACLVQDVEIVAAHKKSGLHERGTTRNSRSEQLSIVWPRRDWHIGSEICRILRQAAH